jgi:tRNA threonylcarbamoyladenosine biosynthesis protein TsaB
MKILAIDTTSPAGSIALLDDRTALGVVASDSSSPYSSRLPQDLDRLLSATRVLMSQVDLYAVATGPGSFTGVRVGLAAVKAWAEVYKKPVAAVSALEAIASQEATPAPLIAAIADAHRGQFYASLYERSGELLKCRGEDVVLPPAECLAYLARQSAGESFLIRTTAPDLVRAAWNGNLQTAARIDAADPVLAPSIGLLGFARAQHGDLGDALTLDAHYVRRSDAETLWKDR